MFLRKRTTPTGGVSYSLLRSVRRDGRPRHEVVACLGPYPTVAQALAVEIIDGEDKMITLALWENMPRSSVLRSIKDGFARRARRIRKLLVALDLTGGTSSGVEAHLQSRRDQHDAWRRKVGLAPYHVTERMRKYTDGWLALTGKRVAGDIAAAAIDGIDGADSLAIPDVAVPIAGNGGSGT